MSFVRNILPTNIGITRDTPSVTTLVVVSDLGSSKIFITISLTVRDGVRNARAGVRIGKKKPYSNPPITKFTLAILVGLAKIVESRNATSILSHHRLILHI